MRSILLTGVILLAGCSLQYTDDHAKESAPAAGASTSSGATASSAASSAGGSSGTGSSAASTTGTTGTSASATGSSTGTTGTSASSTTGTTGTVGGTSSSTGSSTGTTGTCDPSAGLCPFLTSVDGAFGYSALAQAGDRIVAGGTQLPVGGDPMLFRYTFDPDGHTLSGSGAVGGSGPLSALGERADGGEVFTYTELSSGNQYLLIPSPPHSAFLGGAGVHDLLVTPDQTVAILMDDGDGGSSVRFPLDAISEQPFVGAPLQLGYAGFGDGGGTLLWLYTETFSGLSMVGTGDHGYVLDPDAGFVGRSITARPEGPVLVAGSLPGSSSGPTPAFVMSAPGTLSFGPAQPLDGVDPTGAIAFAVALDLQGRGVFLYGANNGSDLHLRATSGDGGVVTEALGGTIDPGYTGRILLVDATGHVWAVTSAGVYRWAP